jgi:hypothetical protein
LQQLACLSIIANRLPKKLDTIVEESRLLDMDFMCVTQPARFNGPYLIPTGLLDLHGIAAAAIGYPKSIHVEAIKNNFSDKEDWRYREIKRRIETEFGNGSHKTVSPGVIITHIAGQSAPSTPIAALHTCSTLGGSSARRAS